MTIPDTEQWKSFSCRWHCQWLFDSSSLPVVVLLYHCDRLKGKVQLLLFQFHSGCWPFASWSAFRSTVLAFHFKTSEFTFINVRKCARHGTRSCRWIQSCAGHCHCPQGAGNPVGKVGCKLFSKPSTTQKAVNVMLVQKEYPYEDQRPRPSRL